MEETGLPGADRVPPIAAMTAATHGADDGLAADAAVRRAWLGRGRRCS